MRRISFFWILLLLSFSPPSWSAPGFTTVGWKDGRAWFIATDGKPFLSMGVNAIADGSWRAPNEGYYDPIPRQYNGNAEKWFRSVEKRLRDWGFNTMGAWCDGRLYSRKTPYCFILNLAPGEGTTRLDSVFSPNFEETAKARARQAASRRDDPLLVGYFLDNELPWWGEYGWKTGDQRTLLEKAAARDGDDPDKQALLALLRQIYEGDIRAFNAAWGTSFRSFEGLGAPVTLVPRTRLQRRDNSAWTGRVADRFFEVGVTALKEADPNHLVMGVRFTGENPWEVVEACGKWCDVVSVNHYAKSGDIDRVLLDNYHARTKKPVLITEYSFRAMENQSGDPNTKGADVTVATQKDRAEHLTRYASQALSLPYVVGLHWFCWADESPQGRFDGEDSNYGLVDVHDGIYELLTKAHRKLNREAVALHASAPVAPISFIGSREPSLRGRENGTRPESPWAFFEPGPRAPVSPWGDSGSGGRLSAASVEDVLSLSYSTGTGWGCGATLPPDTEPLAAPGIADLAGYRLIEFRARAPKGLRFFVFVGESGNAEPGRASYDAKFGADGESWEFPPLAGTGAWETYRVDLAEMQKRTAWGNQRGNDVLDLQAISNVDLYIPGNQGDGVLEVMTLIFNNPYQGWNHGETE